MAAKLGDNCKVYVRSDNGAVVPGTDEAAGFNTADFEAAVDMLDATDFKDTSGARKFVPGLSGFKISAGGFFEPADTKQTDLRTACLAKTSRWITLLPDGTNGYKVEVFVERFKVGGSFDALVPIDFSFTATGAASVV
jgi:hypothetical protein